MHKRVMAALLALGAVIAVPAQSQAPQVSLCKGQPVTIRYSEIKPGQYELFKRAVAEHNAWYAANKNATRTQIIRLTKRSGTNVSFDDGAAMTMTVYDKKPQPTQDAAYEAFVKDYRDSSVLKDEHRGCMGG